ncbi:allantoate permease [Boletus edulis BED1]|uniref:Allantoate permease n=1 Tax=Boletus edulis BED1 TaxID=1328754 RepID=A0AAD4GBY1_BOLED|nr:allantoate permease [Boletus edulis BED1]
MAKIRSLARPTLEVPNWVTNTEVFKKEQHSTSAWGKGLFGKRKFLPRDPDAIATRRSVFDDPHLAPFYWPKQDYENIHRFDPSARWTCQEEKTLIRKIDCKIAFMATVAYFALILDFVNLTQANSANFLSDLHLTTNDFNTGNTIYRFSYLCAELPSQLISKRVCLWSIVSLSQFWLKARASFLACRLLLGILQGGFVPGLVLYMSYFYTKTELPIRTAIIWASSHVCHIISTFLAYGIFHLNGVGGKAGWHGLITLAMGVASFFNMPPSPTQTKTWFRPKGWLTEREEVIIVNKILRDDPTKGDMHNREPVTLKRLWTAVCDYDLWPLYILGIVSAIPTDPPSVYLTLSLRHAGFNTFNTNLLTIPSQVTGMINIILLSLVSEWLSERTFVSMMENLWVLPFLVALYTLPSRSSPWLLFGLLTGFLSHPTAVPICLAWCSTNSGAVAGRTVYTTLYSMFVQVSIAVAAQVYRSNDAPRYRHGNSILIIICSINVLLLYPATKVYYIWRNRQRARIWDAMTPEEKVHYLNTRMLGISGLISDLHIEA